MAFDMIDWKVMLDLLKIHGVDGKFLNGVKLFYKDANARIKLNREALESFRIHRSVRQRYVQLLWLFSPSRDGIVTEMKARVGNIGIDCCVDCI